MFRGTAAAGLSMAVLLIAAPALAAPALAGQAAARAAETGSPLPSASGSCTPTDGQGQAEKPLPAPTTPQWPRQDLDYDGAWKFTQGAGVKVGVIDSGVDASPQFAGRVTAGQAFFGGNGNADCVGHGSMVVGLIAAAPTGSPKNTFAGIAPQATVESYKITNDPKNESFDTKNLVSAINQAVNDGAKVINLSLDIPTDDGGLRAAVENAVAHDVVMVVAAGNDEQDPNTKKIKTGPFFPGDYAKDIPGVVSVGSIDQSGQLSSFSDKKTTVSVTAPGGADAKGNPSITSTFPGGFFTNQGTSFATPIVAGEAALIRSRFPSLTAPEVAQRIEDTADGSAGAGTGNGLINPVQAVSLSLAGSATQAASGGTVTVNKAVPNRPEKMLVVGLAGGAFGLAAVVITAAVAIPAGRRRRWRPASAGSNPRLSRGN